MAVASASGRNLLASGGSDGKVRLWEPNSGRLLRVLSRHTGGINALAFSPDGEWLASASQDSSVGLWRSESGREVHHFAGFASSPTGVCFSPDGKRLATAAGGDDLRAEWNRDRQVVIRDVESGLQLVNVLAHENAVYAVAFGAGGRLLVTGSADNTARIRDAFPWNEPAPASKSGLSRATMLENFKRPHKSIALEATRASLRQDPAQVQPRQSVKTDFGVVNQSLPGWKTQPAFAIPPRDADATTNQLDLAGVYNVALGECWTPIRTTLHVDLNLAELPAGTRRFAGVLFDVRGLVQLRRGTLDTSHFPERVAVETRRSFAQLHALHGVRWQSVDGKAVGGFVLHYVDGRKTEFPIVYGQHLFCELALKTADERSTAAELAWSGADPTGRPEYAFRIYKASFVNPYPDLEVARIEYFSSLGKSAPFLLALTVE
jgi:hypothetical protein